MGEVNLYFIILSTTVDLTGQSVRGGMNDAAVLVPQ